MIAPREKELPQVNNTDNSREMLSYMERVMPLEKRILKQPL